MSSPPELCPVGLLIGRTMQFVEADITVVADDDGVRWRAAISEKAELGPDAELEIIKGPGGTKGHLRTSDGVGTLFDDLQMVQRTIPTENGEIELIGLQGSFSFAHHGAFRRLRTVFLGAQDEGVIEAMVEAFASEDDDDDNVTRLPWTLESLTRFCAAHARSLSTVDQVDVKAPGQLTLRRGDAANHVDLHNLFLDVSKAPEDAQARIERFFAATSPKDLAPLETGDVMLRVMQGTAPVRLEASLEGETHSIELASVGVADDLSAVFVRDTPNSIAYLNPSDVKALGELTARAQKNLLSSLPAIHISGEGPIYMVIAGGYYECSLALLPDFWEAMAPLLDGSPLVAMPSRDLCLITGDEDPEVVEQLRSQIEAMGELAYPISPTIYRVQRQGRWFEALA
jgi:hypothetical protein